jgi:hypothetical protein
MTTSWASPSQPAVVLVFLLVGREFIAPPSVSGLSHCSQFKVGLWFVLSPVLHYLLEDRFCSGQSCTSHVEERNFLTDSEVFDQSWPLSWSEERIVLGWSLKYLHDLSQDLTDHSWFKLQEYQQEENPNRKRSNLTMNTQDNIFNQDNDDLKKNTLTLDQYLSQITSRSPGSHFFCEAMYDPQVPQRPHWVVGGDGLLPMQSFIMQKVWGITIFFECCSGSCPCQCSIGRSHELCCAIVSELGNPVKQKRRGKVGAIGIIWKSSKGPQRWEAHRWQFMKK